MFYWRIIENTAGCVHNEKCHCYIRSEECDYCLNKRSGFYFVSPAKKNRLSHLNNVIIGQVPFLLLIWDARDGEERAPTDNRFESFSYLALALFALRRLLTKSRSPHCWGHTRNREREREKKNLRFHCIFNRHCIFIDFSHSPFSFHKHTPLFVLILDPLFYPISLPLYYVFIYMYTGRHI